MLMEKGMKRMFLFKDGLSTFCLRLYGVEHMVKDYSESERGNLLPRIRNLLFLFSPLSTLVIRKISKGETRSRAFIWDRVL